MKYAYSLLVAAAVLGASVAGAHAAEPAKAKADAKAAVKTEAPAQAAPDADANKEGFFDKVGNWFEGDKDAAHAANKAEPAAGETQQPKKRTNTTINAKRQAPSANDTNPAVGRVISETGSDMGIRSNARMGEGASGSYGNQ